ncbi:MAG: ribosome small subunit-dependent GTPase A [Lachnospiraceae bacterium]|nr:ribosome small subunit-dependent GTPase A [Lachnospiraceae bacterium]
MRGKIVKGISGFYYVHVVGAGIYECKAKGIFRNRKLKPLVGDNVEIAVLDETEKKGNIEQILPRANELIRPAVANIDGALVIFAAAKPKPNFQLLDRVLVMMEYQKIPVTICFNKSDLVGEKEKEWIYQIYESTGYPIYFLSVKENTGIDVVRESIEGKTFAMAGPSGVGKSSLINTLQPLAGMETGEISAKIERGKHTTRHSELIHLKDSTYLMDTPGFSSFDIPGLEKESLRDCYPEYVSLEPSCRFSYCSHIHEPDCAVKRALEAGEISRERYENYCFLHEELKNRKKY